jgi:hypothetical protein
MLGVGGGGKGGRLANGNGTGNPLLHVVPLAIDNFSSPWNLLMKFCGVVKKYVTLIIK